MDFSAENHELNSSNTLNNALPINLFLSRHAPGDPLTESFLLLDADAICVGTFNHFL
jgi:phage gp46-like protein